MSSAMRAIDIKALAQRVDLSDVKLHRNSALRLSTLPVTEPIVPQNESPAHAVLSWRWDVDPREDFSRNVAAAALHATDSGIDYLFMDKVSLDQNQHGPALIRSIVRFSELFRSLPTLAAYDTPTQARDVQRFLHTMRRPWIVSEVLHMRFSPCTVTYVGHTSDQGVAESFGFQHMMKRVWETSFANSLLYVLTGVCDMHDCAELPQLLPQHAGLLEALLRTMTREDALLAAAIISQTELPDDDDRVNGNIDIRALGFRAFRFAIADSEGYWENWQVLLNDKAVATWSEKDFTRDGYPRRKLKPTPDARAILGEFAGFDAQVLLLPSNLGRENISMKETKYQARVVDLSSRFASSTHT